MTEAPLSEEDWNRGYSRPTEWNPVTETLHRAVQGDVELLVWREPDPWAWAVIRARDSQTNVVLGTGEAESEEDAKTRAEDHIDDRTADGP